MPFFRSDVKAWHDKGSVLRTKVLVFFAGPCRKKFGLSRPSPSRAWVQVSLWLLRNRSLLLLPVMLAAGEVSWGVKEMTEVVSVLRVLEGER